MTTNSLAMHQLISLCDASAHAAPTRPFTPAEAHDVVQIHIGCRAKTCPRKASALDTLVEAGRMVLSTSKPW